MKNRNRVMAGIVVAVFVALFGALEPRLQSGATDRSYVSGRFSMDLAGSKAGSINRLEGGEIVAEVVNEQSPNAPPGLAFCTVLIRFLDAQGLVLHEDQIKIGPGEIGSVELPPSKVQPPPEDLLFHVTFKVMDDDGKGRVRPCAALPSVRVFDRKTKRTQYYLDVVTN